MEGSFITGPHTWAQIILMNKAVSFLLDSGSDSLKSLPANAGDTRDRVRSLGREDLLQEGTAAHSSILAYETPQTEKLQPKVSHTIERLSTHTPQIRMC